MKAFVYLSIVLAAVFSCQPAYAQLETLDPVVVTATRTSTPLSQLGSSVTLITREEIEEKQQSQVLDVLRSVPGITVVQSGPVGGQTSVLMRGTDNRHTLILIDGVEFRDASLIGGGANLANINTDNIERIEIVRGPQSVIYGSDAIGGVINIITRKGTEGVHGYASVEGGSYNSWTETAGVALGAERVKASFALSNSESDGFSSLNEKDGFKEKDSYSNRSISMNVAAEMSDAFTLNLNLNRVEAENDFDDSWTPADSDIATASEETTARAEGVMLLLDGKLKSIVGIADTEISRTTSGSNAWDNYKYEGSVTKLDLQNVLSLNRNQTFVLGFETEKEDYESSYGDQGDVRNKAAYLQDQLTIGDFAAALGVRYDNHSAFGDETTWRIAPTYLLRQTNTRLMASAGTGFKAPSLYQLYSSFGDPTLDPEKSLGFDVGLEQAFYDNKINLTVAWFYNDIEDYIDWDSVNFKYQNVKELKTRGVESTIEWFPAGFIDMALGYTYTDTEDENGENKARIPLHKATVNVNLYPTAALQLNANVIYVGKRDDGAAAETLGEYTVVNLAMSYQLNEALKLFGRIDNLFDEEYEEAAGYGTAGLSGYAGLKFSF